MTKLYDRIYWHNERDTALDETNLNRMDKAIDDIDNRVIDIADLIVVVVPQVQQMLDQAEQLVEDCTEQAQNSEAWAVGQRDGQDVPSTDPTYHNNAKWYSEHLQTNIGNLNDVEITNPTDGDALVYDPTTQKWVNGAADVGLFIQNGILMCRYETA